MNRLKGHILLLVAWFFAFYNVERLVAPINLASFVYGLVAVYAALIIFFTPLQRISLGWTFLASLVPYLGLKVLFLSPIGGTHLPLTVTEVVSVGITIYLAHTIASQLGAFNKEILQFTLGPTSASAEPFTSAQADCYREIRRARHYNRPAAVLSIAPVMESADLAAHRLPIEAEENLMRQYISARTADMLRKSLKETDIVTMRNSHFLVLLPETEREHLERIIPRLEATAHAKLGIALKVGASTFPDEAVTFESLVEYAETRMKEYKPAARREEAAQAAGPIAAESQPDKEPQAKADLGFEQSASR